AGDSTLENYPFGIYTHILPNRNVSRSIHQHIGTERIYLLFAGKTRQEEECGKKKAKNALHSEFHLWSSFLLFVLQFKEKRFGKVEHPGNYVARKRIDNN